MNTENPRGFIPLVAILLLGALALAGGTATVLTLKGENSAVEPIEEAVPPTTPSDTAEAHVETNKAGYEAAPDFISDSEMDELVRTGQARSINEVPPTSQKIIEQMSVVPPPTQKQLERLAWFCNIDQETKSQCEGEKFVDAYLYNLGFRSLLDMAIADAQQKLGQQALLAEEKQLECLMAVTPEKERTLDPATQSYLRELRCGTATETDRSTYELSRINSRLADLETSLETGQVFQSSLLNSLKTQAPVSRKFEIRWEGEGMGTYIDSAGNQTKFHCESSGCKSY